MAKSAKAKRDKKKDFQKPKFKVGKARPKADNFTDTSFKARSINVLQQNLSAAAPSQATQIQHHLALLNHRSETQRRDSLSYLTNAFHNATEEGPLAPSLVFLKVQPLILDVSPPVRTQLLKLLAEFKPLDLRQHLEALLLYVRAAMTHLSVSIRVTGVEILDLLLDKTGADVVRLGGGWVKMLKVFMTLLRWADDHGNAATSSPTTTTTTTGATVSRSSASTPAAGWKAVSAIAGKSSDEVKCLSKTLRVFTRFLDAGLVEKRDVAALELRQARLCFPLHRTEAYGMPTLSNPFAYLGLFGAPRDEEQAAYDDAADRQKVFADRFGPAVRRGLDGLRKEGGTIGREAGEAKKALERISEGYGRVRNTENAMLRLKKAAYERIMREKMEMIF